MPTLLTLALPQDAFEKLMDGYHRRDPELLKILKEFGVLEIRAHYEEQNRKERSYENCHHPCAPRKR